MSIRAICAIYQCKIKADDAKSTYKSIRQRSTPRGRVSQLTRGKFTCSGSCCDRSSKSPFVLYISWTVVKKLVRESPLVFLQTFIASIPKRFIFKTGP